MIEVDAIIESNMKIYIYDEFTPQDTAMMQALYSRSSLSVVEHVKKVQETGSGNFMEKFYVGYGHASIADCGSTTIFIEDVSMLVAKAIQDWPLYSGQETSSRYIDLSKRALVDPVGTKESKAILLRWMKFYTDNQEKVEKDIKIKYPKKDSENEVVYNKAVKARAFDTLRGFLPAGITTQLSWHTNLRQASDKLAILVHHPLPEVSKIAKEILSELQKKYPNSFSHKLNDSQENYRDFFSKKYSYFLEKKYDGDFAFNTNIKPKALLDYKDIISKRPEKTSLPNFLADLGTTTFDFLLDFGSFRDIQRHRNGVCRMPLLTTKFGFNEWYLDELSPTLRKEAKALIKEQTMAIKKMKCSKEFLQYYIAMGFNVSCKTTYALPAAVYTLELRSGKMVHPTLRKVAHKMANVIRKKLPTVVLHTDNSLSEWDVRRGEQDIKERK